MEFVESILILLIRAYLGIYLVPIIWIIAIIGINYEMKNMLYSTKRKMDTTNLYLS
jgi:hypothetical protein